MTADPRDVKVVSGAAREILNSKGRFVSAAIGDEELQSIAAYLIEVLDYERLRRRALEPTRPDIKPAVIKDK